MITLTNADAALKDYYLDALSSQLNGGISPFFNAIEKSAQYVYGKNARCALVKGDMSRVVTGDEDGELPEASGNTYYDVTLPLKNIYGTIAITDKAMRASQDSSGAFVNLLNAEMEGLISDAKDNFSRMLFGDGNGLIAYINKANSSTSFTLSSVKSWFKGLTVDIADATGTKYAVQNLKITAVDTQTNTITVNTPVVSYSSYEGYPVVISGVYGKELTGLAAIFDGATLYGHTKASEDFFNPYVQYCEEVTEDAIISAIEAIEERGGGKVKMIICSHAVRNKIAALFRDMRVISSPEVTAGYTSVYVNDIPVYADRFCPSDRVFLLNPDDFVLCQLCDWEWMEDDGGRILTRVAGKAAYNATLVKYAELICRRPYAQGMLQIEYAEDSSSTTPSGDSEG